MRKTIFVLLILILCFILSVSYAYMTYHSDKKQLQNFNSQFEYYQNKEIEGSELATIINKAMDNNEKYQISKDNKGNYIQDQDNGIKIDVHMVENKTTYAMETVSKLGVEEFVYNFSGQKFKCTKIEYHKSTQKVSYLLFEEVVITNS